MLSVWALALVPWFARAEPDLQRARQHWAFRPFQEVAVPEVKQAGWGANEIDRLFSPSLMPPG